MHSVKLLSGMLLMIFFSSCGVSQKQLFTPMTAGKILDAPQLTHQQMLDDYDSLVSYIRQVSPVIYFNEQVRGIRFNQYASRIKKKITAGVAMEQYLMLVEMTLNAAQDGHSGRVGKWQLDVMKNSWIPRGVVRDIDTGSIKYSYTYDSMVSSNFNSKLELNLVYTSGEYYNLLPFSYKGQAYPASMQLISCNGVNVHKLVRRAAAYVSPLRWDRVNNRAYHEQFYKPVALSPGGKLSLTFVDKQKKKHHLDVISGDTVLFLEKVVRSIGYGDGKTPLVTHYFEKEAIFYARLPMMVPEYGDSLAGILKPVITQNRVKAIVIDIRGNPGGSDNTYGNFLKRIVKDTLSQNVVVGRNFSPYNQRYSGINADTIRNRPAYSFETNVATLKKPEMYYISLPGYKFVIPDSVNYGFSGKVYILQDRYIYSSASNLSNLASKNEQLISIGETPDLLGGLQTNPTILQLPYSKIIFRIEPQIDFTNAKVPADIFQNHVEYPVGYSIEELRHRVTANEDIFSKQFLYGSDPFFKKVLQLEKEYRE